MTPKEPQGPKSAKGASGLGWKVKLAALPLTLATVGPSGLTPLRIQWGMILVKAQGTEGRNRLKGGPQPGAVPRAGRAPDRRGAPAWGGGGGGAGWKSRRSSIKQETGYIRARNLIGGAGGGEHRDGGGSRALLLPALRSLWGSVASSRGSVRPLPFPDSTRLAPHISNSQGQLVVASEGGLFLSPGLCCPFVCFCI